MDAPLLRFESVRKPALGLHGIDLALPRGACTVLLGPAGAGKSGALRLMAGLASPDTGRLLLEGGDFHRPPPGWRGTGTFLPAEALPRGRSVEQVVTELLRGLPPRERAAHLARALTALGLDGQEATPLSRLSAPQQCRVALARALAPQPSLLLLDDPLEGQEHATRQRLALELRALVRRFGLTVAVATREAEEAMLLADHLAVLEEGQVAQAGTPQQVYEEPASAFVASLVGENNRLPGTVMALDGEECQVRLDCGPELWARRGDAGGPGSRCIVAVRPERVAVAAMSAEEMGEGALPATLQDVIFLGDHLRLLLAVGRGGALVARRPPGSRVPRIGGPASVAWDPYAAFAFRALR
ncbi:ABC transporter ATP-binding protein [Roseicella aerolata]|uniref:ABC transporter ATP-binding protein n=1 Tax=Roseicella aerolata TaxID=2883479 RepID=A0A9X1L8Y4_9PROT|nr:ABC transporter ATP-binding protein [Roseicella aerolata]MCB4823556.1 ABC transporter ATP-binding protein [Roseicella aerolata]